MLPTPLTPLPCSYQAEEDSLPAWEGDINLYSHSKGGSYRCLACRLGRSLDACHRHAATPFDNPLFLRAALSVIAYSDDTSPIGGGETWLSLWGRYVPVARCPAAGLSCRFGRR